MSDATSDKLVNYLMDRTDKFGDYINELAKQLGVAAKHVYEVLIRQQYTESVGLFVENSLWILIWIVLSIILAKAWKKVIALDDDDTTIGLTIATVIFTIIFLWCAIDIVSDIKLATMKMMNPEYYALEDIMKFIQGKVQK